MIGTYQGKGFKRSPNYEENETPQCGNNWKNMFKAALLFDGLLSLRFFQVWLRRSITFAWQVFGIR